MWWGFIAVQEEGKHGSFFSIVLVEISERTGTGEWRLGNGKKLGFVMIWLFRCVVVWARWTWWHIFNFSNLISVKFECGITSFLLYLHQSVHPVFASCLGHFYVFVLRFIIIIFFLWWWSQFFAVLLFLFNWYAEEVEENNWNFRISC